MPVYQNLKEYCKLVLESRMRQADKTDEVELESVREMHVGEKVCFDITFVSGKRPELADIEKYLKLV